MPVALLVKFFFVCGVPHLCTRSWHLSSLDVRQTVQVLAVQAVQLPPLFMCHCGEEGPYHCPTTYLSVYCRYQQESFCQQCIANACTFA
jgi:hypothetical protein